MKKLIPSSLTLGNQNKERVMDHSNYSLTEQSMGLQLNAANTLLRPLFTSHSHYIVTPCSTTNLKTEGNVLPCLISDCVCSTSPFLIKEYFPKATSSPQHRNYLLQFSGVFSLCKNTLAAAHNGRIRHRFSLRGEDIGFRTRIHL